MQRGQSVAKPVFELVYLNIFFMIMTNSDNSHLKSHIYGNIFLLSLKSFCSFCYTITFERSVSCMENGQCVQHISQFSNFSFILSIEKCVLD